MKRFVIVRVFIGLPTNELACMHSIIMSNNVLDQIEKALR